MLPAICGATVVLRQEDISIEAVESLIRKHEITILNLPPAYLRQLTDSLGERVLPVRLCIAGGEVWSVGDYQAVQRVLSPQNTFNAYGPTEAVISPVVWDGSRDDLSNESYVPIGKPVGMRVACILDDNLSPVPQGVAGELFLGGKGIARAYLNHAGLTADRFIADPRSTTGERLYRTGDLVRWNAQGAVGISGPA